MSMVRVEPSPDTRGRIGEILEEVQEWDKDEIIYLLEDLIDILHK